MTTPVTKTAKAKAYAIAIAAPVAAIWLLVNVGVVATAVLGSIAFVGTAFVSGGFGNAWNKVKGIFSTIAASTQTTVADATVAAQKIDQTLTAKAAEADARLANAAAKAKFNGTAPAAATSTPAAKPAAPSIK